MESGLEDRNNDESLRRPRHEGVVSMESGLEDRNNSTEPSLTLRPTISSQWSPA